MSVTSMVISARLHPPQDRLDAVQEVLQKRKRERSTDECVVVVVTVNVDDVVTAVADSVKRKKLGKLVTTTEWWPPNPEIQSRYDGK